ncbi:DUF4214 domain-containing protein [Iamia majanohamensis]|uniref:DUF4214 domain-containing protein n=1 Tax=Iamia majanohamensis TaxID=467976 RepID=A0AAE9Y8X5_9ACTN|nr:DUF4214 domain-containing protein [Iamia majanohamensis]WCO69245.1 DUF4214 domain-containing protein [Iamia majanohamensis]
MVLGVRRVLVALTLVVAGVGVAAGAALAGAQAPSDGERFVDAAAQDLLGRPATPEERARWVAEVDGGGSRVAVAQEMTHSPEHASLVVTTLYRRALLREPDAAGLAFWTDRLAAGRATATLASQLYGSAEAFSKAGSDPATFVDATYRKLLGRPSDPAGRAYWAARIAAGESRTVLARSLYLSSESNGLRTVLVYLDLLRRPALVAERPYWADRLTRTDDLDLEALVAGSSEYLSRARDPGSLSRVALTARFDGSGAPTISGDGRYVAFTSRDGRLVPGGDRPHTDVFTLDRQVGRYAAVTRGDADSVAPDLSADGSTLVFSSAATNLVALDTNGRADVFAVPTAGGAVRRLVAGNGDSTDPSVSGDGRVVAFTSTASDLVPGADATAHVHVATRGAGGGVTSIQRVGGDGPSQEPRLAAGGGALVFTSSATDLAPGTTPGTTNALWASLPLAGGDVVALTTEGAVGILGRSEPGISADGTVVGFTVASDELGPELLLSRAHTARIEDGAVVDRRPLPPAELATEVVIGDDGDSAAVTTVRQVSGRPYVVGEYHRPLDAAAVDVDGDGDLSADGRTLVATARGPVSTSHVALRTS